MNNKGFTLIELLAVIVILMGISYVAVAGISSSLNKRNKKECEEQVELAKNAAKIYFSLNDVTYVKLSKLISDGYFSETSKSDILISKSINGVKFLSGTNAPFYAICKSQSNCYNEYDINTSGSSICK